MRVVRIGLLKKVTSEQRHEGSELFMWISGGSGFQEEERASAEAEGQVPTREQESGPGTDVELRANYMEWLEFKMNVC